ncbi:MAG TPA: hypothetical protein VGN17_02305 [Bryobacteraceae bacterium]|jgi:hypothetical protein
MNSRLYITAAAIAVFAVTGNAQPRKAAITGGGDRDRGKCTIEVVVDITAEVEIRGDTATLRTVAGQPAQWRRFQCNSVMPPDPINFRFSGVDGRGRQSLVRVPSRGAPAVVHLEDPQGGSEGYTFDIEWSYGGGIAPAPPPITRDDRRDGDRRDAPRRFTAEQAVRVCQDSVADRARDRFRDNRVNFTRIAMDNNPGRNDWVVGMIEVQYRRGPSDYYRFSCSVNFDTGQVRSADIDRDRVRDRDRPRDR